MQGQGWEPGRQWPGPGRKAGPDPLLGNCHDSDDFSPCSAQIIVNPWPSPWVVLFSVHSSKARWAQAGWAVQKGRPKWDREACSPSLATCWERTGDCGSPLSSLPILRLCPGLGQHLAHLTKGSRTGGCCLLCPPTQATNGPKEAKQQVKGLRGSLRPLRADR